MVSFKPLEKGDFELLRKWLNVDFVSKWYERRKFVYREVEHKYTTDIYINTTVKSFLIMVHGKPVGYVQFYMVNDYDAYSSCVDVSEDTAGMDFFIGDVSYVGKGLGKEIVETFLREIVFQEKGITHCITGPEVSNKRAIRVYEKAGFRHLKTVACSQAEEPEYVMIMSKKAHEHVVFTAEKG